MGEFGIGQPVRRFEDRRLLNGNGRFQNDNNLLGQAYAYVLRSPRAHAREPAHAGHLLHHLASFEEAVDQAIDLGDGDT